MVETQYDNCLPANCPAEGLRDDLKAATRELVETRTVLKQFIGEQRGVNSRLTGIADEQERRLRGLELWKAETAAKLPEKWLNTEAVEKRLDEQDEALLGLRTAMDQRLSQLQEAVSKIGTRLATWAGYALGAWAVIQVLVKFGPILWGLMLPGAKGGA